MNILIIEDESFAADKLEAMLREIDPTIQVLEKLGSIKESVKWLAQHSADLIFLDIQLSDGVSFTIFEKVDVKTPIIFTTAYDEYALKAFKVNSISYLLKPISKAELSESITKYNNLRSAFNIDIDALLQFIHGKEAKYKENFVIQIGEKIKRIETSEIAYFYALEKSVFLKTFQNKSYPMDFSLDNLETRLDPKLFFRINRKMIIHIRAIANMTAYSRSRIKVDLNPKPENDSDALVSISRSADFRKWLE